MTELFASFGEVWKTYIWQPIREFTFWDALDILLLTLMFYGVFLFLKGRRAVKLAIGLVLIGLLYGISDVVGLRAIHQIIAWITPFLVIILAIIFQPEIRDGLERLGDKPFGFFLHNRDHANTAKVISEVVDAACQIAQTRKDGALIVIERSTPLGDFVDKGHALDAEVSSGLLCNIFVDGTPLHDGAVIIRGNRIAAACCELPLTSNDEAVRGMGSRHRAAVGISEVSDCVVVVVSEQRHVISIANNGFLKKNYNNKADEFANEIKAKSIQKTLRKDLARILMKDPKRANPEDFEEDEEERGFLIPEIQFTWHVGDKKKPAEGKDKTEDKQTREKSSPAPRENKSRYRVVKSGKPEEAATDAVTGSAPSEAASAETPAGTAPIPENADTAALAHTAAPAHGIIPAEAPATPATEEAVSKETPVGTDSTDGGNPDGE